MRHTFSLLFFFFNDTATTDLYTLPLHDALPIWILWNPPHLLCSQGVEHKFLRASVTVLKLLYWPKLHPPPSVCSGDRKSTRLNSSHRCISYAVFCLKKKKKKNNKYKVIVLPKYI